MSGLLDIRTIMDKIPSGSNAQTYMKNSMLDLRVQLEDLLIFCMGERE